MGVLTLRKANRFAHNVSEQSKKLYNLDLGGSPIVQAAPTQKSRCGVITSLIILIILIFFIILTISQFSKGLPAIIYTSEVPSSFQPMNIPPIGILVKDGPGNDMVNSSIFSVKYNHVTIRNQDALPRVKIPLTTVLCSFDSIGVKNSSLNMSVITTKAQCPKENVVMAGTYEMPTYQYLDIEVQRCICPPTNTSCGCASDAEFNAIFWAGSLSVFITESIPSYSIIARGVSLFPDDPDLSQPPTQVNNTKSFLWKNIQVFLNRVDLYMKRKTVFNGPRYIFDYHFSEFHIAGTPVARPDDFDPGYPLLFKAYLRVDSTDIQEMRQSPQFLQLIGSWGALWSFFSLTALALVRFYNNRVYIHNHKMEKMTNELIDTTNDKNIEMSIRNSKENIKDDPNNNNNNNNLNNNNNNNVIDINNNQQQQQQPLNVQIKRHSPKNILYSSSGSLDHFGWHKSYQDQPNQNNISINESIDLTQSNQSLNESSNQDIDTSSTRNLNNSFDNQNNNNLHG